MTNSLRVLLVEDQPDDAELVLRALKNGGFDVAHERVFAPGDLKRVLQERTWDIIISDYSMPNFTGFNAFSIVQEMKLDIPFIIVSGTLGEETAVEAMRFGVHDYILKDRLARLVQVVKRELEQAQNRVLLREKEKQLLQAQKMELVGRLAGGVAHDFNNILVIILLYCGSILNRLREDDPSFKEICQIQKAGERAAALTKQLLAFSRKQVINPRTENLNDIIEDVAPMLSRLIGEHVQLDLQLDQGIAPVKIDAGSFHQVLMNLAANAKDAMPQGGRLTIRTSNIDLPMDRGQVPRGSYVKLSVTDTGHGMNEETQVKIFEPFFTTKAVGVGTGLGLSTVFGIVQQSEGFITVDSRIGAGSSFHIYLQKGNAAQTRTSTSVKDSKTGAKSVHGARILLIEDDEGVREVLREVLETAGGEVLPPKTPREALDFIEGSKGVFDLMVCDVMMPEMSGPTLVARMKQQIPSLKVLLISGYLEMPIGDYEKLRRDAHFLQKPFAPSELVTKVNDILEKQD